ncbi:MAG TPA: MFS transporter [Acidimicrobiales bacterium]|jgi:EmrB/QacA subfamily drug resistance transporter|nr:MFS transporter [Acidimicrobiales bacterium]
MRSDAAHPAAGAGEGRALATPSPAGNGSDGAPPGFAIKKGGLGSAAQALALATLCGVLFLTFLDNTVVSVGLANVQSDLHAGVTSLQWVVNGYALTFASFMLAAGMLGDLLGRKRIMLAGVAVFCAGSVVAATASNVDWLIAGRVIMGVGAAASEPGTLSIIRHVYPDRETRADALGVWAAISGLALALGPVIGGALVGFSSWRAIFWFNLGFGLVAFVLAAVAVPESADRQGRRIDGAGFFFGAAFLACMSFAVIQGEQSGYLSGWIVALFVLCGVSGVAFVITEHRVKSPMLDLSLFRRPPFSGATFVAFAAYFGTFSIFFFTALYLQVVANASAYQTAIDFLPMAAGLIIVSGLTGPLVARIGPRWPMTIGCLLAGGGILIANAVLDPTIGFGTLGWALPIAGIGIGMLLVPVTSVPLTVVPPERSGMAASATNTSREMGAVFGVAILGAIVNAKLTGDLAARLKAIGIPPNFQSLVEHAIQTGGTSGGAASSAEHSKNAAVAQIAKKVINAAYDAFGSGLHEALLLSGCLILAGAVVSFFTIHRSRGETYDL